VIMDANSRLQDALTVTVRFIELLTEEIHALHGRRSEDVANLVDDKATVSRAYEALVSGLTDEPEALKATAPELRERMRGLSEKLQTLMDENIGLLTAAIDVNRRVLHIAVEAAKESQPGPTTYSAMGIMDATGSGSSGGAPRPAVPMSVNHSL